MRIAQRRLVSDAVDKVTLRIARRYQGIAEDRARNGAEAAVAEPRGAPGMTSFRFTERMPGAEGDKLIERAAFER